MNCDCIEKVNAQLREHNQELRQYSTMEFPECKSGLALALEVIGTKKGVKGTKLFLKFCPFCGHPAALDKSRQVTNLVWLTEEEAKRIPRGSHVFIRTKYQGSFSYAECRHFRPDWVNESLYYRSEGDLCFEAQFAIIPESSSKYPTA